MDEHTSHWAAIEELRKQVSSAVSQINAHEQVCAERYNWILRLLIIMLTIQLGGGPGLLEKVIHVLGHTP